MAEYAQEFIKVYGDQKEVLAGGKFEVVGYGTYNYEGHKLKLIKIKQNSIHSNVSQQNQMKLL